MSLNPISQVAVDLHEARLLAISTDDGSMESLYVRAVLGRLVNFCIDSREMGEKLPGAMATEILEDIYDMHEFVKVDAVRTRLAAAVVRARRIINGECR